MRHRHTKNGFTYDPSSPDKKQFLLECLQYKPKRPYVGSIAIELMFFMQRPKAHYGTGKNLHTLKPKAPYEHITKPDTDNLAKFVLDALGGCVFFFHDDRQVMDLRSRKLYANKRDNARTSVWISPVEKEDIERWNTN